MVFKPGTGFASSNYVENAKKLNPYWVHSMRSFIPHVGSFYSPMWGYQRHNSYRVAMPHSTFIMQHSTNCKTIFHRFFLEIGRFGSNVVWHCTKIPLMICFLKAGSTANSVRVVLLKARGWRGTSLPRVCDNMLRPLQNSSYNLSFLNIFVPLWYETKVILSQFC